MFTLIIATAVVAIEVVAEIFRVFVVVIKAITIVVGAILVVPTTVFSIFRGVIIFAAAAIFVVV